MSQSVPIPKITYNDYLALEASSPIKNEYLCGEIYAMSGGTPEHARLSAAIISQFSSALAGRPCNVYSSDLRVRIVETDLATYPDVTVVCGKFELAPDDPHAVVNPTLLVEVLSDSTEAYDRGAKSAHYRHIPSLREYALICQKEQKIEIFRRNDQQRWELFEYGPGEFAEFASVDCKVEVNQIYHDPLASSRF